MNNKIHTIGIIGCVLAVLSFQFFKVLQFGPEYGFDFRLIWIAGTMWLQHIDPYSSDFIAIYHSNFGVGPNTHFWVYPPYWFVIAVPFSLISFKLAAITWNCINFICLLSGTWLISKTLTLSNENKQARLLVFGLILICSMQATGITIAIGQTSLLIYFGLALCFYGVVANVSSILFAGLVIVTLKPNVGLVVLALALGLGYIRPVIAVIITISLGCVPAFYSSGIYSNIAGFIQNLRDYNAIGLTANHPPELVGLIHLLDYLAGSPASATMLIIIAAVLAFWLGIFSKVADGVSALQAFAWGTALLLFMVPLHSYDMVLIVPLAAYALTIHHPARWLIGIGTCIAFRAGNIASITSLRNPHTSIFPGSTLESFAVALIFIAILWIMVDSRRLSYRQIIDPSKEYGS